MPNCKACGKALGFLNIGKVQQGEVWYCDPSCAGLDESIREYSRSRAEVQRLENPYADLSVSELIQKKHEHEANIQRSINGANEIIDGLVAEIRGNHNATLKERGLDFLELAEFLTKQARGLDEQVREGGTYSPEVLVEGACDMHSRAQYFAEEARSTLSTHLAVEPGDFESLIALAQAEKLLGHRTKATRLEERAKAVRAAKSTDAPVSHQKDRSGLVFEGKAIELVRLLGFSAQSTARSGDGGIDIIAVSTRPLHRVHT